MSTVFSDNLFRKVELTTLDQSKKIVCTVRQANSNYQPDLLRQDTKTIVIGRAMGSLPSWLVPGTVLYGVLDGFKSAFTYEGVVQSRVEGLTELLGARVRFSVVTVSEF